MDKNNAILDSLKKKNFEMYKYLKIGIEIITTLKEKMYEAYIVGGAVRDYLLNKNFNDIDICTNATPDAVKDIFKKYKMETHYEYLGSIVLKIDGYRYEITTFRNEEYSKQKIRNVHYSKKLYDDIMRRDYTINALAMSPNLTIIDIVKGQSDLDKRIIKIIGKGKKRFKEDPSRILRGIHLVARYNFTIDSKTKRAMKKSRHLLADMSEQKCIALMKKILSEEYSQEALKIINANNLFKNMPIYEKWVSLLIKNKKLTLLEQMTLLYRINGNIPEHSGHTHEELTEIKKLYNLSQHLFINQVEPIMVLKYGLNHLVSADRITKAYNKKYKKQEKVIKKIYKHLPIHSARELNISPDEIKELLNGDESKISTIYSQLLVLVVNKTIRNDFVSLSNAIVAILDGKEILSKAQIKKQKAIEKKNEKLEKARQKKNQNKEITEENNAEILIKETQETNITEEETNYLEEYQQTGEDEKLMEQYQVEEVLNELPETNMLEFEEQQMLPYENNEEITNSLTVESVEENVLEEVVEEVLSEQDIRAINMYKSDFNELYKIYLKSVLSDLDENLSSEQEMLKRHEIELEVKNILIDNNPIYRDLNDRGKI